MSETKLPNYDDFDFLLQKNKVPASASEVHGILTGCITGGMNEASREWVDVIAEFCMDGEPLADEVVSHMLRLYKDTFKQLKEGQLAFEIFLPEDDVELCERADALIEWINGFLSAIGMQKINFQGADEEVREAFQDLIAISKMDTDLDESEENFQAFEEIVEYIRVTGILCFGEFGDIPDDEVPEKPTLH